MGYEYSFVEAQGVFQEAIKIIDENFPKDSTEFKIEDHGFNFVIRKYKGEAPERRDDISDEKLIDIDEHRFGFRFGFRFEF